MSILQSSSLKEVGNLRELSGSDSDSSEYENVTLMETLDFGDRRIQIFLGGIDVYKYPDWFERNSVDTVVRLCHSSREMSPVLHKSFPTKTKLFDFCLDSNSIQNTEECAQDLTSKVQTFIDYLKGSSKNVLIHCYAGQSRSVLFYILFRMIYHSEDPEQAIEYTIHARSEARDCNHLDFIRRYHELKTS